MVVGSGSLLGGELVEHGRHSAHLPRVDQPFLALLLLRFYLLDEQLLLPDQLFPLGLQFLPSTLPFQGHLLLLLSQLFDIIRTLLEQFIQLFYLVVCLLDAFLFLLPPADHLDHLLSECLLPLVPLSSGPLDLGEFLSRCHKVLH